MSDEQFASVWDAIEDMPAEAETMKLRSILMTALKDHIAKTQMSQGKPRSSLASLSRAFPT